MSRRDRLRNSWIALGVLLAVGIVVLSVLNLGPVGPPALSDKVQHVLAYAALCGWFCAMAPRRWLLWFCASLALGVVIELIQYPLPHRQFEWADMLADAVGAALGSGIAVALFPSGVGNFVRKRFPALGI